MTSSIQDRDPDQDQAMPLRAVATATFTPRGFGYDAGSHLRRRVVPLRGGIHPLVVVFSWVAGTVRAKVVARGECSSDDVEGAIMTARALAAVDDDPAEFLAMVRQHPLLGPLAHRSDTRIARTPTVFESFTSAVIEQLVTSAEARASIGRLSWIAGAAVPGTKLRAAPTAAAVRRVPMWQMHAIGVGSRRAATLREGAGRGAALERLRAIPPEVALEKLQSLPGVGPWTANVVARRGLGWSDAVPVGDFHAPFAMTMALTGVEPAREDRRAADAALLEALAPFRPHRARVALLLEGYRAPRDRPWRAPRVDPHRREPWRY